MKKQTYKGKEKRQFARITYTAPLNLKVCKKSTVSKLLKGYTANISENGLLCNIKERVKKNDILWLSFDRGTLNICENLERKSLIYQNGVIAKVVRIEHKKDKSYDIGVRFLTREEKNMTHIYPKIHFLKGAILSQRSEEESNEDETGDEVSIEPEKIDWAEKYTEENYNES